MATAQGSKAKVQIGEESTFNTMPGTPSGEVLPVKSCGIEKNTALGNSEVLKGDRNPIKPFQDKRSVGGPISTELNPFMGLILKHLFGSVNTTGTGPYVHTFKIGALPTSLWIEKGYTDIAQYFVFNGCRINSATFAFSGGGGVVPLDLDIVGASQSEDTSSADATPTDNGHEPFRNYEASIEEGGSSIAIVTEISGLNLVNNLDGEVYCLGGAGVRSEIPEGMAAVTGTLTALFQNMTLYNKAKNFTESSLKITLSRGSGDGSAGNEALELFIPELIYEEKTPPLDGPQGVRVALPFRAYYSDSAQQTALQAILKNTIATY